MAPEKLGRILARASRASLRKYDYNPALLRPLRARLCSLPLNFRPDQPGRDSQMAVLHGRGHRSVREIWRLPQRRTRRRTGARRVPEQDVWRELIQAFREFKSIWDPHWKMNPGKVIDPYRMDENLRLGAELQPGSRRRTSSPGRRRQLCPCRHSAALASANAARKDGEILKEHHVSQLHGHA